MLQNATNSDLYACVPGQGLNFESVWVMEVPDQGFHYAASHIAGPAGIHGTLILRQSCCLRTTIRIIARILNRVFYAVSHKVCAKLLWPSPCSLFNDRHFHQRRQRLLAFQDRNTKETHKTARSILSLKRFKHQILYIENLSARRGCQAAKSYFIWLPGVSGQLGSNWAMPLTMMMIVEAQCH